MRFGIAMLVGAAFMFALGTGLKNWSGPDQSEKTELRRPAWAENRPQEEPREEAGLGHEFERLVHESESPGAIVPVSHQHIEDSLRAKRRELQRMRLELDRQMAQIEAQLLSGVTVASVTRSVGAAPPPALDQTRPDQVVKEVYRELSAESVTSIVSDLVEAGESESVMAILEMLDDRKAAKVLTGIAGKRPQVALMLTDRLVQQRTN